MGGVHVIQQLISVLSGIVLTIDGVLGTNSMAAFYRLSAGKQTVVRDLAKTLGVSLPEIKYISMEDVGRHVRRVAFEQGVPAEYLLMTLRIENIRYASGYKIDLDGKHRGLGQFNRSTWEAIMVEPWDKVGDPYLDVTAIAKLYKANRETFSKVFGSLNGFTVNIAYLYHNQGASSAATYLKTGRLRWPKQSQDALALFRRARGDYHASRRSGLIA